MSEHETPNQIRFGLWHIFYFTALIASGSVVAGPLSLLISGVVLIAWWLKYRGNPTWHEWLAYCLFAAILVCMLLPATQTTRGSFPHTQCSNNMRQCMLAMLNYESAHMHFPLAWTEDDQGRPMHSWRVLILPFIEQQNLYDQYRLDEPWDSPHNIQLADQMPLAYRCPSAPDSTSQTTYKLVSDPDAFVHGSARPMLKNAVDGLESTIVLVEDSENPVNWMKPEGISIEEAVTALLSPKGCHCGREETLFATRFFGQNSVTLDGRSLRVASNTNPESLRRAMRHADGHAPDLSEFSGVVHKPQGYIALATYLFLLALPGWYLNRAE